MNYFIGIDVSKSSFNYSVIDEHCNSIESGKLSMEKDGFDKLKSVVDKYKNSIVACESTGSFHINLISFLISFKKEVALINPSLIKRFSHSVSLRKTKTDEIDANLIAMFVCKNKEHINYLMLNDIDRIVPIARLRESIAKDIAKTKTQLRQHLNITFPELERNYNIFTLSVLKLIKLFPSCESVRKASSVKIYKAIKHSHAGRAVNITPKVIKELAKNSIGTTSFSYETLVKYDVEHILFFMDKLEEIEKQFIDSINKNKKEDVDILTSIKGIGDTTASYFIAEIGSIERFENKKKLIAYIGTDPSIAQSGSSINKKGRISKKGSKSLRRTLYIMAMGTIRTNDYFKAYYLKKRQEGMQHRKAIVALINKLIRVIYALLKKREKFSIEKTLNANNRGVAQSNTINANSENINGFYDKEVRIDNNSSAKNYTTAVTFVSCST
jgi:transposase